MADDDDGCLIRSQPLYSKQADAEAWHLCSLLRSFVRSSFICASASPRSHTVRPGLIWARYSQHNGAARNGTLLCAWHV